jgi:arylsulfatase A-like enzyme
MSKPNVLWIFVDQLRLQSMSCTGDPNVKTPNLDRLAAQGVSFTRAASTCTVCTPARAAVVTGQYPSKTGITYLGDILLPSQPTVSHAFRQAGYRTSFFGKWHLSSQQNPFGHNEGAEYWVHPLLRGGFQDWAAFELSNHFWKTRYSTDDLMWPPHELKGYQTDALTDLSLDYLKNTAVPSDQPWFHVLSLETPHHGSDQNDVASCNVDGIVHTRHPAPPEYEARFKPEELILRDNVTPEYEAAARSQQAQYCAMIENLDDNIGRILDWLDETGLADNTLVAFFSDHGEMGGCHNAFQKCSPYAESVLVPFILRLPGKLPAGLETPAPANLVDLFPTSAALCDVPVSDDVQGIDLMKTTREASLSQWFGNPRYGNLGGLGIQWRGIITEQHTYAVYENGTGMLFDDQADPYQLNNLYGKSEAAAEQKRLHALLVQEVEAAGETVPGFVTAAG